MHADPQVRARSASPVDLMAEAIFDACHQEAHAYVARHQMKGDTTSARLGFEVGMLHSEIRQLCYRAELAERLQKEHWARLQEALAALED